MVDMLPSRATLTRHALNTTDRTRGNAMTVPAIRPAVIARRMPSARRSATISFVLAGTEGSLTTGTHPDGHIGEIVLRIGKQGSALAGLAEAFSAVTSPALQSASRWP
ncbi:MAG TPA: hypothetical protein VFC00_00160 [Micromonosporaceae bacterium]|nr:hypothetical protein [Micromonosporaceae bacterium]